MSAIYKYHLGKKNNSDSVRILLNDLLFQKKAEMTANKDMYEHVELLENQINIINKRSCDFSDFSLLRFQEESLEFDEALLLLIGINPGVMADKHFKDFNLTNYTDTDYLATFIANRVNDTRFLRKSFFTNNKQTVKLNTFINKTLKLGYFSRELFIPKSATSRHKTKTHNLGVTKDGLIKYLLEKSRSTPAFASSISSKLHEEINDKLIAFNNKGEKPNANTIRKYIGEIINHTDWQLQPESIRNQIITKS
jgi:hypothetical protein